MRHHHAANRHRDRAGNESPRRAGGKRTGQGESLCRQTKQEIDDAQSEEGNVSEPVHPAFETGVTAEPVFAVKEHSENHSGNEAKQNPEPGKDEIWIRFHLLYFGLLLQTYGMSPAREKYYRSLFTFAAVYDVL